MQILADGGRAGIPASNEEGEGEGKRIAGCRRDDVAVGRGGGVVGGERGERPEDIGDADEGWDEMGVPREENGWSVYCLWGSGGVGGMESVDGGEVSGGEVAVGCELCISSCLGISAEGGWRRERYTVDNSKYDVFTSLFFVSCTDVARTPTHITAFSGRFA